MLLSDIRDRHGTHECRDMASMMPRRPCRFLSSPRDAFIYARRSCRISTRGELRHAAAAFGQRLQRQHFLSPRHAHAQSSAGPSSLPRN